MCGYRCVGAGAKIQIPPYTKVSQSDSATRIGARPSAPAAKAHHNVGGGRASLTPPNHFPLAQRSNDASLTLIGSIVDRQPPACVRRREEFFGGGDLEELYY